MFKPLSQGSPGLAKKPDEIKTLPLKELIGATEERIHIIYDDSGSMSSSMQVDGVEKNCQTLAAEATVELLASFTMEAPLEGKGTTVRVALGLTKPQSKLSLHFTTVFGNVNKVPLGQGTQTPKLRLVGAQHVEVGADVIFHGLRPDSL